MPTWSEQENNERNAHGSDERRVSSCDELILQVVERKANANEPSALEAVGRALERIAMKLFERQIVVGHGLVVAEHAIRVDA